jgi:hypothetical protein
VKALQFNSLEFTEKLNEAKSIALSFSKSWTEEDLLEYKQLPQNTNDHPAAVASRAAMERLGIGITYDIADLGLDAKELFDVVQANGKRQVGGCYNIVLNKIFISLDGFCIPSTYLHELAHALDLGNSAKNPNKEAYDFLFNHEKWEFGRSEAEFVAESVSYILGKEYGINGELQSTAAFRAETLSHPMVALGFIQDKLTSRIEGCYLKLKEALAGGV